MSYIRGKNYIYPTETSKGKGINCNGKFIGKDELMDIKFRVVNTLAKELDVEYDCAEYIFLRLMGELIEKPEFFDSIRK